MQFIEVLRDGLTVSGTVRRAGDRVQTRSGFKGMGKKAQTKRWGSPRYREITRADFEAVGGEVQETEVTEAPESAEVAPVEVEDKFASLADLNIEDTLMAVSEFSEGELAEFVAYEVRGQNRKGVLEPLGFGAE